MSKKVIEMVAWILAMVGALNWGLVGLFNLDLVDLVLGSIPMLATAVYILVGLSAVVLIVFKIMEMQNMNIPMKK